MDRMKLTGIIVIEVLVITSILLFEENRKKGYENMTLKETIKDQNKTIMEQKDFILRNADYYTDNTCTKIFEDCKEFRDET